MRNNRFTATCLVTIGGVRRATAISPAVLKQLHARAMHGLGMAMTRAEVDRWSAWSAQWPFSAEQRADLGEAHAAAVHDIAFVAARDAAAHRP